MAEPIDSMNQGRAQGMARWGTPSAGSAQTIATSGTIQHGGFPAVRITEAGNVTSIIVAPGLYDGQMLFIQNEANQTITMATAATSNVFGGTAVVIPASRSALLRWDAAANSWFCCFSG